MLRALQRLRLVIGLDPYSAVLLCVGLLMPVVEPLLPQEMRFIHLMCPIFIFALMGLGLNVVLGFTGLLNLGAAAFMAIGAYTYGILTCDIYPFQFSFWLALVVTGFAGCIAGVLLGLPTLRLRGDYLAIVTLGFGEIVQDSLRNLDSITKGSQGINPLPGPSFFGHTVAAGGSLGWYYILFGIISVTVVLLSNIERSRTGRIWKSIRDDELASQCMGINPMRAKLSAFATGACLCALGGGLWASYLGSTGEPGNYDFQISVIILCLVMVGGIGSTPGVLLGAVLVIGFNSIVLVKLSDYLTKNGIVPPNSVLFSPTNWKYFIFGMALILITRYRPQGVLPASLVEESCLDEVTP